MCEKSFIFVLIITPYFRALFFVFITFALLYFVIMLYFRWQWSLMPVEKVQPTHSDSKDDIFISVIVASYNDKNTIQACIDSILNQSLPKSNYELIVINDGSNDGTETILENLSSFGTFQYHSFSTNRGKKAALSKGIEAAKGEWIVTTDADCKVPTTWLSSFLSKMSKKETSCIAAPVAFRSGDTALEDFQALDFCGMMAITAVGIEKNLFRMSNGANFAFRKSAYEVVGGYESNREFASGDDMFLIQKIAEKYPAGVCFLKSKEAIVNTNPASTLKEFWHQRLRWGSKNKALQEWSIVFMLGIVWVFCTSILFSFFALFFSFHFIKIFIFQILLKASADYLFLSSTTEFFDSKNLIRPKKFTLSFVFHTLYIAIVGTAANLFSSYEWKGLKKK